MRFNFFSVMLATVATVTDAAKLHQSHQHGLIDHAYTIDPFNSDSSVLLGQTYATVSAESHQNSGAKGDIQNLIQAADDKISDAMDQKKALLDKQKKEQESGQDSGSDQEGEQDTSTLTIEQMEQKVKAQDKKMQAQTKQNEQTVKELKNKMDRAQTNLQTQLTEAQEKIGELQQRQYRRGGTLNQLSQVVAMPHHPDPQQYQNQPMRNQRSMQNQSNVDPNSEVPLWFGHDQADDSACFFDERNHDPYRKKCEQFGKDEQAMDKGEKTDTRKPRQPSPSVKTRSAMTRQFTGQQSGQNTGVNNQVQANNQNMQGIANNMQQPMRQQFQSQSRQQSTNSPSRQTKQAQRSGSMAGTRANSYGRYRPTYEDDVFGQVRPSTGAAAATPAVSAPKPMYTAATSTMSHEDIVKASETPIQAIRDIVAKKQEEAKECLKQKELEAKQMIDAIVSAQQQKNGNGGNTSTTNMPSSSSQQQQPMNQPLAAQNNQITFNPSLVPPNQAALQATLPASVTANPQSTSGSPTPTMAATVDALQGNPLHGANTNPVTHETPENMPNSHVQVESNINRVLGSRQPVIGATKPASIISQGAQ